MNSYKDLGLVHLQSVDNHNDLKWKILDTLEMYKIQENIEPNNAGYYYDFGKGFKRPYLNYAEEAVYPILKDYSRKLGCSFEKPRNDKSWWFQQYIKGTTFGWHNHNKSVAIIYYVELPDSGDKTDFYNFNDLDIKEGDVIIFPSYLVHRSKPLLSNKRKTIISCNFSLRTERDLIYADRGKPEWIKY